MSDWLELTERLRRMGVSLGLQKEGTIPQPKPKPIEAVLDGEDTQTIFGPVYTVTHDYGLDYVHGITSLAPIKSISRICRWAKAEACENTNPETLTFLDTETTGLSGGTGTIAFMIGAARYRNGRLQVKQFFLRNPAEENAQLAALDAFCEGSSAVVTYNGKSFDLPILNTRFILNGMRSPFLDISHFDLLGLTRRIWRSRLEACTLNNIEKQILRVQRSSAEVPGYLVPEYYREYLRSGNAEAIKGVFYHNEIDVLSLAALFKYLALMLEFPYEWENSFGQDRNALASVLEKIGDLEEATGVYAQSLESSDSNIQLDALLRTAFIHKRKDNAELALSFWKEAAQMGSVTALIELAKYYEHKIHNPVEALYCTTEALKLCGADLKLLKELEHRSRRLVRKINSLNNS